MASDTEQHVEHAERPVREQLRKATISHIANEKGEIMGDAPAAADPVEEEKIEEQEENGETDEAIEAPSDRNGSPARKRSFEEVVEDERSRVSATNQRAARHHSRKRSRDSTAEEDELNNGQRKISGEIARDDTEYSHVAGGVVGNGKPRPAAAAAAVEKRPGTPELKPDKRGEAAVEEMTSPKSKRSRLHSTTAKQEETLAPEASTEPPKDIEEEEEGSATTTQEKEKSAAVVEPEEKKESKIPATSGFANTSTSSPFASLSGTKSPTATDAPPQTSTSAFAASGFSGFSGSGTSGFGALGDKSAGGFGSGRGFGSGAKSPLSQASTTDTDAEKSKATSSSTFGGALGQKPAFAGTSGSGFGSTGSGSAFGGKLGSTGVFGSGSGFGGLGGGGGGGLKSFASGNPSSSLGANAKPSKAFGAPPAANDEDEESEEGAEDGTTAEDAAGFKSPLSQDLDKQDERFYEQEVETGEENEKTEFSCRAKLYNFAAVGDDKKEWKERGLGVVRLNVKKPKVDTGKDKAKEEAEAADEDDDDASKPKARLLMRAEGSHRVILNTPIKKEIRFGTPEGLEPKSGYLYFMGAVDGKTSLELMQLKVRQQFALELYERIKDLQTAM